MHMPFGYEPEVGRLRDTTATLKSNSIPITILETGNSLSRRAGRVR